MRRALGHPGRARPRGFTYLMLLWWVAISGVMLAALGHSWALEGRRQREAELVFRGEQIARALAAYNAATPAGQPSYPATLEALLADDRSGQTLRHLRRLWPDPITGGDWALVNTEEGITGVHSRATTRPLAPPPDVTSYDGWVFDAAAVLVDPQGAVPPSANAGTKAATKAGAKAGGSPPAADLGAAPPTVAP